MDVRASGWDCHAPGLCERTLAASVRRVEDVLAGILECECGGVTVREYRVSASEVALDGGEAVQVVGGVTAPGGGIIEDEGPRRFVDVPEPSAAENGLHRVPKRR